MSLRLPFRSRPKPVFPPVEAFGFVELRGGGNRLVYLPSLGGKIVELELAGRQWLWSSDVIPLGSHEDGASFVERGDSGGFDECFPTVGACRVPGWVRAFGGIELPDHGELWTQVTEFGLATTPEGQIATSRWSGIRYPYRLTRSIVLTADGTVRMDYELVNEGNEKFPFVWSSHPLFNLSESSEIVAAEGLRLRHFAQHHIEFGEPRSEHRWPFIRGGGRQYDLSRPWSMGKRFACKVFLDMTQSSATLCEGAHQLTVRFDPALVTHLGVWLNKRGWTPFRDREAVQNLALEPAIGAPDTLSDALGDWKSAAWLEPGQARYWWLEWSAQARADTDGVISERGHVE